MQLLSKLPAFQHKVMLLRQADRYLGKQKAYELYERNRAAEAEENGEDILECM